MSADLRPAFDEAFAHLSEELDVRFDAAEFPEPSSSEAREAERLVGQISDQLRAIEQQRDRLVGLLDNIKRQRRC